MRKCNSRFRQRCNLEIFVPLFLFPSPRGNLSNFFSRPEQMSAGLLPPFLLLPPQLSRGGRKGDDSVKQRAEDEGNGEIRQNIPPF